MFDKLREKLSAERIAADLSTMLREAGQRIELDGKQVVVPPDVALEVVARSLHAYDVEMGFGDHYRVLVAMGGIGSVEHGVVEPGICFATLWYSSGAELITVDFTTLMP